MALMLNRRLGEALVIDGDIVVRVCKIKGNQVKLQIEAPPEVEVWRYELTEEVPDEQG